MLTERGRGPADDAFVSRIRGESVMFVNIPLNGRQIINVSSSIR